MAATVLCNEIKKAVNKINTVWGGAYILVRRERKQVNK